MFEFWELFPELMRSVALESCDDSVWCNRWNGLNEDMGESRLDFSSKNLSPVLGAPNEMIAHEVDGSL